ncbi:urea transporter [Larkinella humicola]|uniref:Peptidoglycan DD-metalloendopeptidase family protein n=1 Tax=Larkinella humicola TaxID=2607654 RepID=A0A5N1J7N2_9BACT|nr:urea transporter [Larkinella humicola]KAA9347195.1 peptidoglycan DD-metalloendopeptidase family protein [Larkinella humicola]
MKNTVKTLFTGVLNSYAQLFFTQSKVTGVLVLLASFTNPSVGLWGLTGAVVCNLLGLLIRTHPALLKQGMIGYNGVLVSLGLASTLQVNGAFLGLFGVACLLTVGLSIAFFHQMSQLNLPSLSMAFVSVYWIVMLAVTGFSELHLQPVSADQSARWYGFVQYGPLPDWIRFYLQSLGGILFQGNVVAGLLVVLGILWASRISFTLSVLGFLTGYGFFSSLGGNPVHISDHFIGFNFVLTALALGGFMYIPNWRTYGLVLLVMPVVVLLIVAGTNLFGKADLPVLSLPFVMIVPLVMYALRKGGLVPEMVEVTHQHDAPEINLYSFRNYRQRFGKSTYLEIGLPFFGEWTVYQGYNGKHTHKDAYRFAWDFVIRDVAEKSFRTTGLTPDDYYGYNMPVVAPASGYVVTIVDGIEDNPIGNMNMKENWGNAIVIKHADYLYSKIAHLKKDSFTVRLGDYVRKGDVVGILGNSGRSPEPHIHFQVQATPDVGAPTIQYPITYYLLRNNPEIGLKSYDVPQENETIANIRTTPLLRESFGFVPGQVLQFQGESETERFAEEWVVGTTSLNQAYLHCAVTGSTAFFVNDGTMFYFSSYTGPRHTLLYYFYLAAYKVMLGFYRNTTIDDEIPLHQIDQGPGRLVQDFLAPFAIYRHYPYRLIYGQMDNYIRPKMIQIQSSVKREVLGKSVKLYDFEMLLENKTIAQFTIRHQNRTLIVRQILPFTDSTDVLPAPVLIEETV